MGAPQVEKLLALFELVMEHPFAQSSADLQLMVVILATFSGAAHREAFVEKLYGAPSCTLCMNMG